MWPLFFFYVFPESPCDSLIDRRQQSNTSMEMGSHINYSFLRCNPLSSVSRIRWSNLVGFSPSCSSRLDSQPSYSPLNWDARSPQNWLMPSRRPSSGTCGQYKRQSHRESEESFRGSETSGFSPWFPRGELLPLPNPRRGSTARRISHACASGPNQIFVVAPE